MVPLFGNCREKSTAKNYGPVSLPSVISKVFGNLVYNRIVDHLAKCSLFSSFQYDFGSSRSTACLLRVVSDTIARTFSRFWTTQAGALDIFKALNRVWHAGHAQKLSSYGTLGQIFDLISSFLSNRRL